MYIDVIGKCRIENLILFEAVDYVQHRWISFMLLRSINNAFFFSFSFWVLISRSFNLKCRFILYIELSKQVSLVYSLVWRHNILIDCKYSLDEITSLNLS